jgi:hypothetical protein
MLFVLLCFAPFFIVAKSDGSSIVVVYLMHAECLWGLWGLLPSNNWLAQCMAAAA